ncbi:MAG TPA: GNAT family N-acetyltransferase [Casimicrobiaceae bacterium]|nr:GNAT family N-acetyltransferase [Casimicrobiaceae bacterium]
MQHYLWPLLRPRSVALVGASERPRSLGRTVYENLLAGGFQGDLYAVNPRHAKVLERPAYRSLAAIGAPIDLAIVAAPPQAVVSVLEAAGEAKIKVAVVMTAPAGIGTAAVRAWSNDVAATAQRNRIRIIGPGALGVIRPASHLNATYCAPTAVPGRLALIAQSGAVATAMLDFATPLGIGFSCVVSLGGGIDVGFGELLDLLLLDAATDGILLYVEEVGDTRAFMSALRAAARTKPVVVLKAGRSQEPPASVAPDAVFHAALMRAGTVRVATYTQLFAAARILAGGRIPQGDRVAIVSNGRGPALLAADHAAERGVELAALTQKSTDELDRLLGDGAPRTNPIDVRNADPDRHAAAVSIAIDDPNVDVVIALHVPRPNTGAIEAAQALAQVARDRAKPVIAAWLGAIDRAGVHAALEAGGISNFYTPENAVDALSFLAAYRNNQAWLLEVPPPQPEPEPLDLASLEAMRLRLAEEGRNRLMLSEASHVLAMFGIGTFAVADSLEHAEDAVRALHPPLVLEPDALERSTLQRVVRSRRALAKAWGELHDAPASSLPPAWKGRIVIREVPRDETDSGFAVGTATDRRFGPVIVLGPGQRHDGLVQQRSVMLPPLNARLAADLVAHAVRPSNVSELSRAKLDPLIDLLTRLSALACALPWIRSLVADPVVFADGRVYIGGIAVDVDPQRKLMRGYPHMAIHPYPVELIGDVTLRDGTTLHVRPIRPEDAELERAFVDGLSEQTRYFRFFYRLAELTPSMIARFTQVDYDRELALVALVNVDDAQAFVGVARYIANPDRTSAEFAVVVADAWQRRGVARVLMRGLIVCAKRRGFEQLVGTILRVNEPMLDFVRSLGFVLSDDPEDSAQVSATLSLATQ